MHRVAITGLGAVSCFGRGREALRRGLLEGRDGLQPMRRFDLAGYRTQLAGVVPDANAPGPSGQALCVAWAVAAIQEAVAMAGLDTAAMDSPRAAVILGLSPIEGGTLVHHLAEAVRQELGWGCAVLAVSTACSSSTTAIGLAGAWLERGAFDVAVAGGSEALVAGLYAGFHALGALSDGPCAPFSTSTGTTLAEGAGMVVLQREAVRPIAWLQGFGLSNGAWHETGPHPAGLGLAAALRGALHDANADSVDYVNAHGTGTAANDIAETLALRSVLGEPLPPVSSTKGHLGHAQAAAGALELVAALLCAESGTVPPTLRAHPPRARMPVDCVVSDTPRPLAWTRFAKNSSAFGGANTTLVLGTSPGPAARTRPVWIGGVSAVGRHGATVDALAAAWEHGPAGLPIVPAVPRVRRVDTIGLDPASAFATVATAAALQDAGVRVGRGATDRIGVIGGLVCASPSEKAKLDDGIAERGLMGLPVTAFARLVLNAAPAAAARALGLRGPHTAVSTGAGSGLAALVVSATLVARDPTVDAVVALGVFEPPTPGDDQGFGAAGAVVQAQPSPVRLAGIGLGSTVEQAAAAALAEAGLRSTDLRFGPEQAGRLGRAPGLEDLHYLALGVAALRSGRAGSVLITGDGTMPCAAVLVREAPLD